MTLRTILGVLAMGSALAVSPAMAQNQAAEKDKKTEDKAMDIASQPVEDVGLSKKEIPPALKEIVKNPYNLKNINTCSEIIDAVTKVDNALGPDFDAPKKEKSKSEKREDTATSVAGSVVNGIIPFRGLVRKISGAEDREKRYNQAVYAGVVRRSFLKGIGLQKRCKYPGRPR